MALTLSLSLAIAMLLAACGAKEGTAPVGVGGPPKMPPAEVGVVTVQPQSVALQTELPGRVSAVRVAQVRARINGVVLKRLFREGSDVKAGESLFQIDASIYQAALDSTQAALGRAQANQNQASSIAERYKPLVAVNAVSQLEYSNAVSSQKLAEADVASAKAAVQTARINLEYATVRAPISGHIGQALVTEGALVSQAEATQLALIQQTNVVYVNFTQSSEDLLRLRKAMASNQLRGAGKDAATVRIRLEDGSDLPRTGRLLFSDLNVDPTSGQVTLRAEVPNPDGLLLPGQYVRVRLVQAELPSAILLPQQAVTRSNQGDSVLVVGADGVPTKRQIKLGGNQNNQWIVQGGLKSGEQVIVDGFQKMMVPGAPVKAVPWNP
ncbi:MAG: efflux RND transporter periplasmic adaptor subunit, partial [Burkholderiaceae bacterium]